MSFKLALSWFLYQIGHLYSFFMLKTGLGYWLYRQLMLWSCDLDGNAIIWKRVNKRNKYKRKLTATQKHGCPRRIFRTRSNHSNKHSNRNTKRH